jgi:hypothetical protein
MVWCRPCGKRGPITTDADLLEGRLAPALNGEATAYGSLLSAGTTLRVASRSGDLPVGQKPVQPSLQKYSDFPNTQISAIFPPSRPTEGRFAVVTNAGWDAVDAASAIDEQRLRGRRSRVVLTPRRWCQVGGRNSADDGGKKARSPGRARNKP